MPELRSAGYGERRACSDDDPPELSRWPTPGCRRDAAIAATLEQRVLVVDHLSALDPREAGQLAGWLADVPRPMLLGDGPRDLGVLEGFALTEVRVPPPSNPERVAAWRAEPGEIAGLDEVAALHRLPIARIEESIRDVVATIATTGIAPDAEAVAAAARRASAARLGEAAQRIDGDLGWDDLVLPPRPLAVIEELYARHREPLLLFLARRTADPQIALDLWAETFAHATSGSRRVRGRSDDEQAGWLYAIARRRLALYYRRGHAERRALDRLKLERPPADPGLLAEIERRAELAALRAELAAALAQLSPAVRDAVRLRVVEERTYPDVAQRLGISEPAARARVSRGLAGLAALLNAPTIREALTT